MAAIRRSGLHAVGLALCVTAAQGLLAPAALADKINNPTAIFAGLDKITGRIISFEVAINETVQFGSLHITPRVCFSRPPTEAPQTTSFVEVDEVVTDKQFKKVFRGWMFAASPGLHGLEHPVYDAWLTDCKGGTEIIKAARPKEDEEADLPNRAEPEKPTRQRAERRRTTQPNQENVDGASRRTPSQSYFPQNPGTRPGLNPFGNY